MSIRHRLPNPLRALIFLGIVTAPAASPHLDVPTVHANRQVELAIHGDPGVEYSLQWSTNLSTWSTVATGVAANNGSLTLKHDASAFSEIFYRAQSAAVASTFSLFPAAYRLNVDT